MPKTAIRIAGVMLALFLLLALLGCAAKNSADIFDFADIDEVRVFMGWLGNGASIAQKTITDEEEIAALCAVFQSATIGKRVEHVDSRLGAYLRFLSGGKVKTEFSLPGDEKIILEDRQYMLTYESPFDIGAFYEASSGQEQLTPD